VLADAARDEDVIAISALTGEGIDDLRRDVAERLMAGARVHSIDLQAGDGGAIAWLHQHGEVLDQAMAGETLTMDVRLSPDEWARFQSRR
jgi:GTP-binding protein HflX